MKTNFRISQFSKFLLKSGYAILVKYFKMTKTSLFCSIHQENTRKSRLQLNLIVLTDCHTVLQWMKTKFKICQHSRFLPRSRYVIKVKIWQWLKLFNFVFNFKKTVLNHVYCRIWSFWITFTALQWLKTNFKIGQFSRFL